MTFGSALIENMGRDPKSVALEPKERQIVSIKSFLIGSAKDSPLTFNKTLRESGTKAFSKE